MGVVAKSDVMPALLKACPSFAPTWVAHVGDESYDAELLYIDLGTFAAHLVEMARARQTAEFADVFAVIEHLHIEGDSCVREAATIGLLEGIQNIAGNRDFDPEVFLPWLGPTSADWWRKLNRFWNGEASYVGDAVPSNTSLERTRGR